MIVNNMKTTLRRIAIVIAVGWLSMPLAPRASQSATGGTRTIAYNGQPIPELIEPYDRRLIIVQRTSGDGPLISLPPRPSTAQEILKGAATSAGLIIVAQVEALDGRLSAGRERVESLVSARSAEVLKATPAAGNSSDVRVHFLHDGGTVRVGECEVTFHPGYEREYDVGSKYLLFFEDHSASLAPYRSYVIGSDGRLGAMDLVPRPEMYRDPLDGAIAPTIINRIRQLVRR